MLDQVVLIQTMIIIILLENGGYSVGTLNLLSNTILYVVVGGKGADGVSYATENSINKGGYNGGGGGRQTSDDSGGAGGGATHIATKNGMLSSLSSYKSDILIVAGGGGGGGFYAGYSNLKTGSYGGGNSGGNSTGGKAKGGTQSGGFAFGQGGDGSYYNGFGAGRRWWRLLWWIWWCWS